MNYTLVPYQKNFFNTRYYTIDYWKLRENERLLFKEKLLATLPNRKFLTNVNLNFLDAIQNICYKEPQKVTIEKNLDFNNIKATITIRGTYEVGRNLICKQMARLDQNAYTVCSTDFKTQSPYILSIFPLFKTVVTGVFAEDVWYSSTDMQLNTLKVNDYLDIIKFIYEHPILKEYNLILEGNKFQPYLNKFSNYSKSLDKNRNHFDLYIVNDELYDYFTTPLCRNWWKKHGWFKTNQPDDQYCAMDENLFDSEKYGIINYAMKMGNTEDMLIKLLMGDLLEIKHYKNKPLID